MTPALFAGLRIAADRRRELLDRAHDARRLRAARRSAVPGPRGDERTPFARVARSRRPVVRG